MSLVVDDPIMIQGITARSGTNLLYQILLLHPDCCEHLGPIRENFFLAHSHILVQYAEKLYERWTKDPSWGCDESHKEELLRHLGCSLLTFLRQESDHNRRLVTKTPSVVNILNGPTLFPRAKFVLLVRDGRDVAESALRSWGTPLEETTKYWVKGVERVCEFLDQREAREFSILIRYEELVEDRPAVTAKILQFLRLDLGQYPFDKLMDIPILGSSDGRDWRIEPMRPDFSPLRRWRRWTHDEHIAFNSLAGTAMQKLGYEVEN